jgi:hypothetical protein
MDRAGLAGTIILKDGRGGRLVDLLKEFQVPTSAGPRERAIVPA